MDLFTEDFGNPIESGEIGGAGGEDNEEQNGSGTCSMCHAQCCDPDFDRTGIKIDNEVVCTACSQQ